MEATQCDLKSIADILLCDTHHLDKDENLSDPSEEFVKSKKHHFPCLEYLNLRSNQISKIDFAINLAPQIKTLLLGANKIEKNRKFDGFAGIVSSRIIGKSNRR